MSPDDAIRNMRSVGRTLKHELSHPEWIRTYIVLGAVAMGSIVAYQKFENFTEAQRRITIDVLRPEIIEAQKISTENQRNIIEVKELMMDKPTFRRFLKQWDAKNPTLPATPLFDDTFHGSQVARQFPVLAFKDEEGVLWAE